MGFGIKCEPQLVSEIYFQRSTQNGYICLSIKSFHARQSKLKEAHKQSQRDYTKLAKNLDKTLPAH